jgi:enoyl-CoA hydratase/carnithine racemase
MASGTAIAPAGIERRRLMLAGAGGLLALGLGAPSEASAQPAPGASGAPGAPGKVAVEQRKDILLIGIDRPASQNRIDAPTLIGLGKTFWRFEHDDALRVAVLHGIGADFCLGIDREAYRQAFASGLLPPKDPDFLNPLGLRPPLRSKPVVVAVQGGTKYVGHELFLAADIRVAAADAVFSQGEVARGVFPAGGGTVRMVREACWGNAMRYILTGEEWDAEEARRLGLVQEVTPVAKQLDRAIALAEKVAAAAPLGVRATLASAQRSLAAEEATALAALQPDFAKLLASEDAKEFDRALSEGRQPVFRGR